MDFKLPKYLSREQVKSFFAAVDNPKWRAAFTLIYYYGLRRSELVRLRWEDIDLQSIRITIVRSKSGITKQYPMEPEVCRELSEWIRIRGPAWGPLFLNHLGDPVTIMGISERFKHYARIAELPKKFSVHCLRHSIAVHALEIGLSVELVQDLLGHRNINSTLIYAQVTSKTRTDYCRRISSELSISSVTQKADPRR